MPASELSFFFKEAEIHRRQLPLPFRPFDARPTVCGRQNILRSKLAMSQHLKAEEPRWRELNRQSLPTTTMLRPIS